ncbi:aminoglycoside phosphotransferase family protein [Actinopolymorpha alba]|uniref:aminoglycoside phosphotransferase family protein n=1 Tax=Actinopolymorpha alba TaxID=533267 RepID=UPI0007C799EC|nr:aminoglycoside phosphotransferase family protein [Actinopolymorpha alba]
MTSPSAIPPSVVAAAAGRPDAVLLDCEVERIDGGTGAATAGVARVTARVRYAGNVHPIVLVRKAFQPLTSGPHASASTDPRHWAYWRRELLAYQASLLPTGPGLAAPRCYGVAGNEIYLEYVSGPAESPHLAGRRLGAWQASTPIPELPWLAGHQLAQRIAVSELDWTTVPADPRLVALWSRRHELLAKLRGVPTVLSHGDFHAGNLRACADTEDTVVFDWGTLGISPVGADLAHLALSSFDDLVDDYLAGAAGWFASDSVRTGYEVTLALTGASRLHWMLSRGVPVPDGYADFVCGNLKKPVSGG